jgi:hydrogenase expression/formation protein HypC
MCIAIPGKVVDIVEGKGKVDFSGNIIDVNVSLVNAKIGDYVLVHAGCALEVMAQDKAEELMELFRELEEIGI